MPTYLQSPIRDNDEPMSPTQMKASKELEKQITDKLKEEEIIRYTMERQKYKFWSKVNDNVYLMMKEGEYYVIKVHKSINSFNNELQIMSSILDEFECEYDILPCYITSFFDNGYQYGFIVTRPFVFDEAVVLTTLENPGFTITDDDKFVIIYNLAKAVYLLHSINIVHGSITERNILIDHQCRIQLVNYEAACSECQMDYNTLKQLDIQSIKRIATDLLATFKDQKKRQVIEKSLKGNFAEKLRNDLKKIGQKYKFHVGWERS